MVVAATIFIMQIAIEDIFFTLRTLVIAKISILN